MTDNQPIIQLEGIKKVFYTDEVETHALSGHPPGSAGAVSTWPSPGPSGCGKSTLLSLLGLLDSPPRGRTTSTVSPSPI